MITAHSRSRGFTLIELVVTLAVSAVVAVFASLFIKTPVDLYISQSRHAELQDSLAVAWPSIERDIHSALPNSVRIRRNGSVVALEMLHVVDSARYMSPPNTSPIKTAGQFRGVAHPLATTAPGQLYLSVENKGTGVDDAYRLSRVMTPASTTFNFTKTPGAEDSIVVTPAPAFVYSSPVSRIYLVDGPVTYLCNETAGTIRRYEKYKIATAQTSNDTDAELMGANALSRPIAHNVSACNFNASPGTTLPPVGQIVTLGVTAARNGESATVMYRAAVERLP